MRRGWKLWRTGQREVGVERGQLLEHDEVLRLPSGRGSSVRVERGVVVVTREGDPEDHVLLAGMEVKIRGRGKTLAWALEPALLHVRTDRATRARDQGEAPARLRHAASLAR